MSPTQNVLSEFSLNAFSKSLRNGTGKAAIHIKSSWQDYPETMRPALLYALKNDLRHDHQLEDSRAPYLFMLFGLTNEKDYFRRETLEELERVSGNGGRNIYQLMGLGLLFAKEGDIEARQALYVAVERYRVERYREAKNDLYYGSILVELDGIKGLFWLAERYFLTMDDNSDRESYAEDFDGCIRVMESTEDDPETWRLLESACRENPTSLEWFARWKAYREAQKAEQTKWRSVRKVSLTLPYAEVKARIHTNQFTPIRAWGRDASPEQLEEAAQDLCSQTDSKLIFWLLPLFSHASFPLPIAPLVAWAQVEDAGISHRALQALENIKSEEVRAFALTLLETGTERYLGAAIGMFDMNYQEGDEAIVLRALQHPYTDLTYWHQRCMNARNFVEEDLSEKSVDILRFLYEEEVCCFCRFFVVKNLDSLGQLSDAIRSELPYDAEEDTRNYLSQPKAL